MKKLSISLFLLLFLLSPFALAVPHYINYQGVLRDDNGDLVNADLEMAFSIYDASEEGSLLWSETHDEDSGLVEVRNGLFNVYLGSVNDDLLLITFAGVPLFDGSPRWLQVKIGNENMDQRIPLYSVPYAYRAESLKGYSPDNFVWLGPSQPQQSDSVNAIDINSTNSEGYAGHFTGGRGIYADGITTRIKEITQKSYDLQNNDSVIFVRIVGNVTINLPATSDKTSGRVYYFYNVNSTPTNFEFKVANTSTETINGAVSYPHTGVLPFHGAKIVGRNSTSWVISLF